MFLVQTNIPTFRISPSKIFLQLLVQKIKIQSLLLVPISKSIYVFFKFNYAEMCRILEKLRELFF